MFWVGKPNTGFENGSLSAEQWRAVRLQLRLTTREHEVLERLFDDASELAIAMALGISEHTVHTHIRRMYGKLGVSSRTALLTTTFATFLAVQQQNDGK